MKIDYASPQPEQTRPDWPFVITAFVFILTLITSPFVVIRAANMYGTGNVIDAPAAAVIGGIAAVCNLIVSAIWTLLISKPLRQVAGRCQLAMSTVCIGLSVVWLLLSCFAYWSALAWSGFHMH